MHLADEPSSHDSLVGLRIGEYELRQRIGVGGMGLVYDGIQPLIGKRVAVKVLRPELAAAPEQVARLLAEARAVNAIRHRGIVDIFGFGQVPDGRQYIIMEYLEGIALDAYLAEKGRLGVPEVLDILDEVLSALGAAHGAGVVHRDLKPSNIFLVQQPDGARYVKLLDFGLAKQGLPTGRTAQTRTDMVVGTPEYMAPEQARGQPVGPMTDLYALGVVGFEMLTGRLPFTGSSPVDLLMKHVDARPPRPSEFISELPPALDAFILQMLTKDPEARPGSAEQLRRQLHRLRDTLVRSEPAHPAPPPPQATLPAPVEHAPAPPAPEAPRSRPTTLLPAASVPLGSARSPVRRLLPVGVGALTLVAATGVLFILREPTPPAPVPAEPTPRQEVTVAPPVPTPQTPPAVSEPVQPEPVQPEPVKPEPVKPEQVVAQSEPPPPAPLKPRPRPASDGLSQSALLGRVRKLERDLDRRIESGKNTSPAASTTLDMLRQEAEAANSSDERLEVARKLSDWEKLFLRRK